MSVSSGTVLQPRMINEYLQDGCRHQLSPSHIKTPALCRLLRQSPRHCVVSAASGTPSAPKGPNPAGGSRWWDKLNRNVGIRGPDWKPPDKNKPMQPIEEQQKAQLGDRGYRSWELIRKEERQRAWDSMRLNARIRYERGEMPEWFDPEWLQIEEAPTNTYWREQGREPYQVEDKYLALLGGGQDGPGDGGSGLGGGGGSWWWNEDDPYWPMRDWGDHPMRWWTLLFAGVLAAGGLMAFLQTGCSEAMQVGWAAATVLTGCSMAMSDMTYDWSGHIAVKVAWSVCALLACKELFLGWHHQRRPMPRAPHLQACGWTAICMCVMYMWTGMSGLEPALPMNPGGAFKVADAAMKHRVWENWGYGHIQMR